MIAPSLALVQSRHVSTREVGIGRMYRWHSGPAALPEVVAQGGTEALLRALPSAGPEARLRILELLLNLVPVADARARLIAHDAASISNTSCMMLKEEDAPMHERCEALASALVEALRSP